MKTTEKILKNIANNKELSKRIEGMNYYNVDTFIRDAQRYVKAIKEGRMINSIGSVSSSGMSRTIKFISCEKSQYNKGFNYQNYFQLFKALGYTESRAKDHYFSISGCGMDMIFHTNYSIIHNFARIGLISKKTCEALAQKTPTTI